MERNIDGKERVKIRIVAHFHSNFKSLIVILDQFCPSSSSCNINGDPASYPIQNRTLVFAYGTLKRGFPNHNLLLDLISGKDATFLGPHKTSTSFPLIIGPHGIPYLINIPGSGFRVAGELYSVTDKALARLDELEGVGIGHYERLPVEVDGVVKVEAEAYFGHRSFGEEMWRRKSGVVVEEYTAEMAVGYVRKADRIGGSGSGCILDDIKMFLEASVDSS